MTRNDEALRALKARLDIRINNYLCEMKPNYDDSITGFNEAWDIVRKAFDEELARAALSASQEPVGLPASLTAQDKAEAFRSITNVSRTLHDKGLTELASTLNQNVFVLSAEACLCTKCGWSGVASFPFYKHPNCNYSALALTSPPSGQWREVAEGHIEERLIDGKYLWTITPHASPRPEPLQIFGSGPEGKRAAIEALSAFAALKDKSDGDANG